MRGFIMSCFVSLALAIFSFCPFSVVSETAAQQDGFPLGAITAKCSPGYAWPFVGCQPWDGITVHFDSALGDYGGLCISTIPEAGSSVAGCSVNVPFSSKTIVSIDPNDIPEGYLLEGEISQEFSIPDGPPTGI